MPLVEGDVFAGYTVVRKLGAGGMGEVYLVQHPRLPRYDALKILPVELTVDREYRERFNREADVVARLWHPHIVGVHDRGENDGQLWITMDFVEGTDAAKLLADQGGGLPPEDVVRIVTSVAEALDYAHQQGLLHRDVKPSNILLAQSSTKFSRALLADFGIARWVKDSAGLTATDMTVGTVAYAAPEQLMGQTLDGRADQYALAATAFHLLTGQQLFQHDNPAVVISNHLTASPPSIGDRIPELSGLGPAFDRALSKLPADRFDSCSDFAEAMAHGLSEAAQGLGATDPTMAAPVSGKRIKPAKKDVAGSRRLRLTLLAAGTAAVLVGGAIAIGVAIGDREEPGAQRPSAPPAASAPAVPVVRIGADCDPLGAAGVATSGQQAYCSRSTATNNQLWSIYQGTVPDPHPTAAPDATDEVYPSGIEEQVQVCVSQTEKTRAECRKDIREGNMTGPA